MKIQSYRDLEVWKLSKDLACNIYAVTDQYPQSERFGLTQQIRRATVSIMSNLAEGSARRSKQEFMRFINIASGSLCEMESQLLLSVDLGYVQNTAAEEILIKADRISKMLYALHRSLQQPSTEYQ